MHPDGDSNVPQRTVFLLSQARRLDADYILYLGPGRNFKKQREVV